MTDSTEQPTAPPQNTGTTGRIAALLSDGSLFVAAALVMAVVFPGVIGVLAVVLALAVWFANWRGLRAIPLALGPLGWVLIALLFWICASVGWSIAPTLSMDRAIRFAVIVVIAMPAILLVSRSEIALTPPTAVMLIIAAMAGVLIFEAASGGMLQRMLPGNSNALQVLFTAMTVLMWPVVTILAVHYGKREAALWVVVCLGAIAFSGVVELRIAVGLCLVLFLLGLMSKWLVRFLLWIIIVFGGLVPAMVATFAGDFLADSAESLREFAPELPIQIDFWRLALEKWADSPLLGWGAGTAVTLPGWSVLQDVRGGFSDMFIHLLMGIGGVGVILVLIALILTVHRVISGDNDGWRLASKSALMGAFLALPVPGDGIWQSWWIGALIISAIAIAGCRKPSANSAALGSIFDNLDDDEDEEPEDDGLYHFDNGDDDDEYYDIDDEDDDESEEWDVDSEEEDDGPDDRNDNNGPPVTPSERR